MAQIIVGIDEAGRGPLAGPVVVAACVLPVDFPAVGLRDSKKLSDAERRKLALMLKSSTAVKFGLAIVGPEVIDTINILQATLRGMEQAYAELAMQCDLALVDGNKLPKLPIKAEAIIGGDDKIACISAASILAKVARDDIMIELHRQHPAYQFDKHKGYGTALHRSLLQKLGPLEGVHRHSFAPVIQAALALQ